ncbi:MAG: hypothetical protein JSV85_07630 [Candidatus Bathyarchaeota archaeon]|nr:MAG: hypothetical protein JSV85_07630 [Candidatus Bathyarchaeota archaeon]
MKCEICSKKAMNEYCKLHERAKENIIGKYNLWKTALNISWKEYLNEITKNPYTGSSAKELAEHLKQGEQEH